MKGCDRYLNARHVGIWPHSDHQGPSCLWFSYFCNGTASGSFHEWSILYILKAKGKITKPFYLCFNASYFVKRTLNIYSCFRMISVKQMNSYLSLLVFLWHEQNLLKSVLCSVVILYIILVIQDRVVSYVNSMYV